MKMKVLKHIHLSPTLMLMFFTACTFVSCGDDNDNNDEKPVITNNENQNPNTRPELRLLEFPHVSGSGNNLIVVHKTEDYGINYSIEWDCDKKAQRWTCYQMHAGNNVINWSRNQWYNTSWNGDPFQEDPDIPSNYNVQLWQHESDGFDRGHICASQDRMCSRDVNEQTFYLSNMHPQYNTFNAGIWSKMEQQLRYWNKDRFRDTLYICKGGTIDKKDKVLMTTTKGLIVPKYFFMAVLCKNSQGYKAMAFLIEHNNENRTNDALSKYVVSIDRLEEFTGLDFFCNLPDDIEKKVESQVHPNAWGLN